MMSHRFRFLRLLALLALGVVLLAPDSAFAQRPGRRGAKTRHKASTSSTSRDSNKSKELSPGAEPATFSKFEPVTSDTDEELLGVLTIKPLDGGTLKLNVRRTEGLKLAVADRSFELDPLPDFLSEGLFCTANWDWDKKPGEETSSTKERAPRRSDPKRLESLSLDTLTIEGTIEEISGDIITIKAKPANDQQWPDIAARLERNPPKANDKPRRIASKKLRVRIVDNVSAFKDAAGQELSLGDFDVEQKVQASIVYAGSSKKRTGILVDLSSYTAEKREGGGEIGPQPRGPRSGPQQPGKPRTRHGGGRR